MGGYKFRRQYSVGEYIVDFYCAKARLAIKIDGATYIEKNEINKDKVRQKYIEFQGIRVVRFLNIDIKNHINGTLEEILKVYIKIFFKYA